VRRCWPAVTAANAGVGPDWGPTRAEHYEPPAGPPLSPIDAEAGAYQGFDDETSRARWLPFVAAAGPKPA
jgi:hypothetical protein